jgi:cytochrome c peroxidase
LENKVKAQFWLPFIVAAIVAITLGTVALDAKEASATLSPQALQEIAQVEAEIDRIEAQTIQRLAAPPDNQVQQIELLGKLLLYDKQLSVNRNEACAFCHARGGLYRSRVGAEPDYRLLSGVSAHTIQQSQAAIARLCAALARAALQSRAG